jgi:hypothetical protein
MFEPLVAIIRRHSKHYKGITLHIFLLGIGCYYSITEGLKIVTEMKIK